MFFLFQIKIIMFTEERIYKTHVFAVTIKSLYCAYAYVILKVPYLQATWCLTVICTSKNLEGEVNIDDVRSLFLSEHQF